MIMLATVNFVLCLIAGLLCVFVLACRHINTLHPLSLLYVTLTGFAFVVWMIEGTVHPERITMISILTRGMVLGSFWCWAASRVQCEHGVCQIR